MILCSDSIQRAIREDRLVIDPVPTKERYTTSAVDLRLGSDFRIWDHERLTDPPAPRWS